MNIRKQNHSIPPIHCHDVPHKVTACKKRLVGNEICGNIKQDCNGEFVTYWKAIGITPLPSGSVTVMNKSNCVMTVGANLDCYGCSCDGSCTNVKLFTLTEKDQSKSITLGSIACLMISCDGEVNQKASGRFCIELHYEKDCLPGEAD
ncbi:S-Ena type endospore appendage [Siminovitchia sediminis]|uniref:S-Ena type endospore appendage n=1 Tax=Siminovitchia sediminis TaxID=1274353 RepID=A0ABW4KG15_9BACI